MNDEQRLYSIALTQVPGVGVIWSRNLLNMFGSAREVFARREELPALMPGIPTRIVDMLDCPQAIDRAGEEMEFALKNDIQCLTIDDPGYPSRLRECNDAPIVLFYKGSSGLNGRRIISMVGTRQATEYGKLLCGRFLRELKGFCPDVTVVSGLAYGIDIYSHRAALENRFPTIAVLAHGLDRIYPHAHRKTAVDILSDGGLLTEFTTGNIPDKHNFVSRNRIIAGMADATIVVESAAKGGSLITADIANSYNRECYAFPGRTTDELSQGCNRLIKDNKAGLIQSAEDFAAMMGWGGGKPTCRHKTIQRQIFPDLSEEEQSVVSTLQSSGDLHINNLVVETDIPVHKMNALLFEMEMKGIIRVLAGGMYQLLS